MKTPSPATLVVCFMFAIVLGIFSVGVLAKTTKEDPDNGPLVVVQEIRINGYNATVLENIDTSEDFLIIDGGAPTLIGKSK